MGGFIALVVGASLIPVIADSVSSATVSINATGSEFATNVTGSPATLLDLTTLFYAIAIMAVAVGLAVASLKEAGLF